MKFLEIDRVFGSAVFMDEESVREKLKESTRLTSLAMAREAELESEIARLKAENAKTLMGLTIAVEALQTLKVAVNDKQQDPGAVLFIQRTLLKIQGTTDHD